MKEVLITGWAGFIGSHLVDKFVENNFNVVVLTIYLLEKKVI